jgi:tryptophan halogenase
MKRVAVIGVGTAGITSLSFCLAHLDSSWQVYSISDPKTPILGIGETTTPAMVGNLYSSTKFNLLQDGHELDATLKYGVKYSGWRKDDFFSHSVPPNYAMHFNNFKLKEFSFNRFTQQWGDKFVTLNGKIDNLKNVTDAVEVSIDGEISTFDYVIDCRGYPDDYSDCVISQSIPVNHCLVHIINEPGEWNWSYTVAHKNGWMFGIPLQTRQGWGYLYNDTITTKDEAVADIAERFKTTNLNLKEFAFKNYYAKTFIDGRIIKNGNRALFFEPMEGLSGVFYDLVLRMFAGLVDGTTNDVMINNSLTLTAQDFENFICYVYHGGSTYDSEFWKQTKKKCSNHIKASSRFKEFVRLMKTVQPHEHANQSRIFPPFISATWVDFDRNLNYNYFTR